jgi:hypothetical protein
VLTARAENPAVTEAADGHDRRKVLAGRCLHRCGGERMIGSIRRVAMSDVFTGFIAVPR